MVSRPCSEMVGWLLLVAVVIGSHVGHTQEGLLHKGELGRQVKHPEVDADKL